MATQTLRRRNKERLYGLFAQVANALSNAHRLELLDLLVQAPRTVEELAREANMSVANTSQHLQRLKRANLVVDERQGLYIRYSIADPAVTRLWYDLRTLAEQQFAEVERVLDEYRSHRHEIETISLEELEVRLNENEVVLIDVRPQIEYEAGHLRGAISMPVAEIEDRLHELPVNKTIVAYCRGPYCVYADDVLLLLREKGWESLRLEEGVLELANQPHTC